MEGAPVSLILDVIVVVLLGLTIVYAARLSLQLRRLRDGRCGQRTGGGTHAGDARTFQEFAAIQFGFIHGVPPGRRSKIHC